jgi:hypothetical protein
MRPSRSIKRTRRKSELIIFRFMQEKLILIIEEHNFRMFKSSFDLSIHKYSFKPTYCTSDRNQREGMVHDESYLTFVSLASTSLICFRTPLNKNHSSYTFN